MSKELPSPTPQTKKEEISTTEHIPAKPPAVSAVGVLAIIGSLASLISVPLAIYFYFQAKDYPQLTFYENSTKAVVVKAGQVSRLTASYDNREIDTDITAAQVALWNAGRKSVKGVEILKPVVIYTDKGTPILEATIRKTSREVTQLALDTNELQKGRVTVSWNILEQNDGGIIQLIYAGDPNIKVSVDGVIEGQSQIVRREGAPTPSDSGLTAYLFLIAGAVFTLFAIIIVRLKLKLRRKVDLDDWFILGVSIVAIILGIFFVYMSRDSGPPFGF